MTRLSVNVNKIATLRNARGADMPHLVSVALDCERFGADGITIHPRPDERHIKYQDAYDLKKHIITELNIEGNPREKKFIDLVLNVCPKQVTLVPDAINNITSNQGWDCIAHQDYLKNIITLFKQAGIRTSIFVNPDVNQIKAAKQTGTDRIELYTHDYALVYKTDKQKAIAPYMQAATLAQQLQLGINAGHDLNLDNTAYLKHHIPFIDEMSIGHALICEALYLGLEKTIQQYKTNLK